MASNYVQIGDTLTIPAPADVLSGGVVIAGGIVGIAQNDALTGALVDVATTDVWELPKVGADAFTLGAAVYWDDAANLCTVTATANTLLGVAIAAAGAGIATVKVRLN
jgi:predicted RecA/RadA family phage recombinase